MMNILTCCEKAKDYERLSIKLINIMGFLLYITLFGRDNVELYIIFCGAEMKGELIVFSSSVWVVIVSKG